MAKTKTKKRAKAGAKTKTKKSARTKAKAKTKTKTKAKAKAKAKTKTKETTAEPMEQADLMVMDGMAVPNRAQREANVAASKGAASYDAVKGHVLALFRSFYPGEDTDEQILATDPNDFDVDPGPFYEALSARFGLGDDPEQDYFGGFGGRIEHTIAVVTKRWDGKLRK
jgi:hypothetical protein